MILVLKFPIGILHLVAWKCIVKDQGGIICANEDLNGEVGTTPHTVWLSMPGIWQQKHRMTYHQRVGSLLGQMTCWTQSLLIDCCDVTCLLVLLTTIQVWLINLILHILTALFIFGWWVHCHDQKKMARRELMDNMNIDNLPSFIFSFKHSNNQIVVKSKLVLNQFYSLCFWKKSFGPDTLLILEFVPIHFILLPSH